MSTGTTEDQKIMDWTVEEYCRDLDCWLKEFAHMNLARWKLAQNTLISVLVAVLALEAGADPTVAVGVIAVINGISFADLAAVWNNPGSQMNSSDDDKQQ